MNSEATPPPRHDANESRAHRRVRSAGVHFAVDLDDADTPVSSCSISLLDVSKGGCGMARVDPLEVGARIGLHMWVNGGYCTKMGEVRHMQRLHTGWIRIGVRFLEVPAETIQLIREFVETDNRLPVPRQRPENAA